MTEMDVTTEFDTRRLDELLEAMQGSEDGTLSFPSAHAFIELLTIMREFIRRFNLQFKSQQGISSMLFRMIKELENGKR